MVEFLLDLPPIGHRLLGVREQQGAGDQGLTQLAQERPHEGVVRDAHADGPLLRMRQPAGHVPGRRKDERIGSGRRDLDGAKGGIVQVDQLAELSEVRAHKGEVVPFVQAAQPPDALRACWVANLAAKSVTGIGRIGDQGVVPQHGHDLRDAARLRVQRVNVEIPGHGCSVLAD